MKRDFEDIIANLKATIADYKYYTDFDKVYRNVEKYKVELNILNSLIGSNNIDNDFIAVINNYPKVLEVIPILLAVRKKEIIIIDNGEVNYNFAIKNLTNEDYVKFMRLTGLFNLLEKSKIKNLIDYIIGVEVGLDSNSRKNRTGIAMENIVASYLDKIDNIEYQKEMSKKQIYDKYGINLDMLILDDNNKKDAEKKFDFVVKTSNNLYLIETNFYSGGGSKLNETARSFKSLANDIYNINNVYFIWITDGVGWKTAKDNLRETYDVMTHIYTIKDLEDGILNKMLV